MTSTASAPRELATRHNDGIDVTLVWHPADDVVGLVVDDRRLGVRFEVAVPAADAWHAFEHPFAYAGEAPAAPRGDTAAFSVDA